MNNETGLIYIGAGNWLPGIPARDLTVQEVKDLGGEKALIETGLYAKPPKAEKEK